MKKNAFNLGARHAWLPPKILLIMKLIIIIMTTCLLQLNAATYAQKLNFTKKNATLGEVFNAIRTQTGYNVLYSSEKINRSIKVNANFENIDLKEALTILSREQNLQFTINDKNISLKPNEQSLLNKINTASAIIELTGRITDIKNRPLVGVNVVIKGKREGTASDSEGRYVIKVEENQKLIFSMVGFKSQEISVRGRKQLDVILLEEISQMDQVVVTGYGKKRISELTGALSTVKGDDLRNVLSSSIIQNIQGKIAGLIVSNPGGDPASSASISVRGVGSLGGNASTQPLIVIDGLIQDAGSVGNVSPNDVESVTLLKDAASTSLYGSRAANGVLVITTKGAALSAKSEPQINLESSYSWENPSFGKFRMMNSTERYDLLGQAYANDYRNENPGKTDTEVQAYLNTVMPNHEDALSHDTDWMREGYRTGEIQRYNLSLSGGADKFTYYVGGTYHKELPIAITDKFEKYSIRINTEYKPSSKLTITTGFNGTFSPTKNSGFSNYRGGLFDVMPWDYPLNEDGSYRLGGPDEPNWYSGGTYNPLFSTQKDLNYGFGRLYTAGLDAKVAYSFNSWLDLSTANRITLTNYKNGFYVDPSELTSFFIGGFYLKNQNQSVNYITSNVLNIHKRFGLHEIKGLAGFEFNDIRSETVGGSSYDITPGLLSLTSGTFDSVTDNISEIAFLSYLSEANYSYDQKYFVSGSFRRDGSSKFGLNNRYGNFYSIGASWTVSNEAFLKNNKTITNLRLRMSHGTTGNADPVGPYAIYGVYDFVNGPAKYDGKPGLIPGPNDDNPDLHWEVQRMNNLGLNIGLWNRVNLTVDVYDKANTNILRTVQAPITSGVSGAVKNIGKISNKGLEVELNSLNLNGAVKWSTGINIALNRNKVVYLTDQPSVLPTTGGFVIAPGYAIGTLYGIVYSGADPDTGKPSYEVLDANGNKSITTDIKTATLQVLASQQPDFSGGISNAVSYKGITLSVLANFVSGLTIYNDLRGYQYGALETDGASVSSNNAALPDGQTRWQKKGDHAFAPAASLNGYTSASGYTTTRFIEDASYFRIRNIRLDYSLPSKWISKAKIRKANFYLSADNVFTVTSFTGLDPEVGGGNYENASKYPINKKITLGLSVIF